MIFLRGFFGVTLLKIKVLDLRNWSQHHGWIEFGLAREKLEFSVVNQVSFGQYLLFKECPGLTFSYKLTHILVFLNFNEPRSNNPYVNL